MLCRIKWLRSTDGQAPPRYLRTLNNFLRNYRPWQIAVITLLARYISGRLFLMLFLNAPETYSKHYNRNFYRATWILTALDAGFWTAAPIKPYLLRQVASMVLTVWYLFNADDADVKVRKLRSDCSVNLMRISWEKSTSPFIWLLTLGMRPFVGCVQDIKVPRNCGPEYVARFPSFRPYTRVKMFYAGSEEQLQHVQKLVLHFPGGGFVTMSPENHEEYVRRWARHLVIAVCIISVDYCKAPEYPYPYAIEECFDLYKKICESEGRMFGLNLASVSNADAKLKIVMAGDSAGGNLVAATTIKIIEALNNLNDSQDSILTTPRVPLHLQVTSSKENLDPPAETTRTSLRKPDGLLICYGALNFNMASWIAPDEPAAELLRPDSETSLIGLMKNFKGRKYHENRYKRSTVNVEKFSGFSTPYLSLTSRVAYFNDRIIPPEMARGMSLLYLGSTSTVNPATDYYLSPVNAPDEILMEWPRTWMMCGECDPFVDDTIVFAARVRSAVAKKMDRYAYTDDEGTNTDTSEYSKTPRAMTPSANTMSPMSPSKAADASLNSKKSPTKTSAEDKPVSTGNVFGRFFGRSQPDEHTKAEESSSASSNKGSIYEDSDDEEYGEISRDPHKHVTLKIYAGISHAYLNMLGFLPEAHHAVDLTGQWLCEVFELSERMARAKKLRKRKKRRSTVRLEIRDEDNIPDTIEMPLGAEYRVGNTQIHVRSLDDLVSSAAAAKKKATKRRGKYHIGGDSDDDEMHAKPVSAMSSVEPSPAAADIPVFDEQYRTAQPLGDAAETKKRTLTSAAATSARPKSSATTTSPAGNQETKKKSTATATADRLFLPEEDLLAKRQTMVVEEVYSGVDPIVLEHHAKKASK